MNDPLDDDVQCLEIEKKVYSKPSDNQVWLLIKEQTGATSSAAFNKLTFVTTRHSSSKLDFVLAAPKVQQLADEIECLNPLR